MKVNIKTYYLYLDSFGSGRVPSEQAQALNASSSNDRLFNALVPNNVGARQIENMFFSSLTFFSMAAATVFGILQELDTVDRDSREPSPLPIIKKDLAPTRYFLCPGVDCKILFSKVGASAIIYVNQMLHIW